jgi:hypothetical protein
MSRPFFGHRDFQLTLAGAPPEQNVWLRIGLRLLPGPNPCRPKIDPEAPFFRELTARTDVFGRVSLSIPLSDGRGGLFSPEPPLPVLATDLVDLRSEEWLYAQWHWYAWEGEGGLVPGIGEEDEPYTIERVIQTSDVLVIWLAL